MRVLGLDPGALRLGWAVVDSTHDGLSYIDSGILGLAKGDDEKYGSFRRRLIEHWVSLFPGVLVNFNPCLIVSETLPAVGGGNFIAATQSELAKAVITACQVIAIQKRVTWDEIPANTIKKRLTGNGRATKVGVRNAVTHVFPELLPRKKELTTYADESDAIGTALVGAGYSHDKHN